MYLYSFLHPGAQQSQVSFDSPDIAKFPNFANANAMEAVLYPGDVLYLPPLWFHHVSALTISMSVSIWTPFSETREMWKTVKTVLPFKSSWAAETRLLAARKYLENVLSEVLEESPKQFVQRLVTQRFEQLLNEAPEFQMTNRSFCVNDLVKKADVKAVESSHQELLSHAINHAKLFMKATNPKRREIWLGNMCEQLAMTVTEDVKAVPQFLTDFHKC